jgi:HD-GYP domain-containing protein (c-di-GMP phosphodiesterase class II)
MTTELVEVAKETETAARAAFDSPAASPARRVAPGVVARMYRYSDLTGLGFLCVAAESGAVLAKSEPDMLPLLPAEVRQRASVVTGTWVMECPGGLLFYALPLGEGDNERTVALGFLLADPDARPSELILAAAEANWSQSRLDRWIARQPLCCPAMLQNLLDNALERVEGERRAAVLEREVAELSEQIDRTYEEITLLHSLARNLQISRSPAEMAELCLDRLHELMRADGNVVWIEEDPDRSHFLVRGTIPFDDFGLARLIARYADGDWSRPLVRNHVEQTLLGADFPGLKNLMVVPIADGALRSGWILSCNASDGREFGTVEASLLNSVATILGTHNRNIGLYRQHEELLLSFVRSLVSTLDAKDPYTRGHSERVALIARRLGEELGLPEEDLQDVYLSGLLHDIGKIGVDDRILRKAERLSDEEFRKVQEHPMIGYTILQGVRNLQRVLPGVRNHHETWAGKGYPDGLKGEEISLMARILAVADSYDAMGSDRPYRQGMPLDTVEEILRRGAGDQWDARVIDAYFAARDDIRAICGEYSPRNGNLLRRESDDQPDHS